MKSATTVLRTLIESGQFFMADLYTLTLIDGTVIRWTSADIALRWGGLNFLSFNIVRDKAKAALGFSVDSTSITIYPNASDTLAGLPYGQAVRAGVLDGAELLRQKAYLTDWGNPSIPFSANIVGVLHGSEGNISDLDGSGLDFKLSVKSALELFNIDMPRNVYQSTCLHIVYDPGCTLSRAAFTVASAVAGTPTLNSIGSALAQANGYFELGVLAFTSGACNGSRRTVKTFANGTFTFALPLPTLPAAGDSFVAYPGCDRRQVTCGGKFNNLPHFKGFPYVPTPETAF